MKQKGLTSTKDENLPTKVATENGFVLTRLQLSKMIHIGQFLTNIIGTDSLLSPIQSLPLPDLSTLHS